MPLGQTTFKVMRVVRLPPLANLEVFKPPTSYLGVIQSTLHSQKQKTKIKGVVEPHVGHLEVAQPS